MFTLSHRWKSGKEQIILWLILAAAYGLVNENAKMEGLSDSLLIEMGFEKVAPIPQLYLICNNGHNKLMTIYVKLQGYFWVSS